MKAGIFENIELEKKELIIQNIKETALFPTEIRKLAATNAIFIKFWKKTIPQQLSEIKEKNVEPYLRKFEKDIGHNFTNEEIDTIKKIVANTDILNSNRLKENITKIQSKNKIILEMVKTELNLDLKEIKNLNPEEIKRNAEAYKKVAEYYQKIKKHDITRTVQSWENIAEKEKVDEDTLIKHMSELHSLFLKFIQTTEQENIILETQKKWFERLKLWINGKQEFNSKQVTYYQSAIIECSKSIEKAFNIEIQFYKKIREMKEPTDDLKKTIKIETKIMNKIEKKIEKKQELFKEEKNFLLQNIFEAIDNESKILVKSLDMFGNKPLTPELKAEWVKYLFKKGLQKYEKELIEAENKIITKDETGTYKSDVLTTEEIKVYKGLDKERYLSVRIGIKKEETPIPLKRAA